MTSEKQPKLQGTRWDKSFEEPIRQKWIKEKAFRFNADSKKPVFSIDTPPPYVNTPVHIGHAVTYTIMDMIARYKRMTGHEVLFPIGLDRNGLPIEFAAEKKFNVRLKDTPREKFIELCKKVLEEASTESIDTFKKLGHSYNSWEVGQNIGDSYHTDSEEYRTLTQATFIDMWNKGLIYEDERINNWCPGCQTTLADAEVQRKDAETTLNYVKFKIKGTSNYITVATTRSELLCTAALIVFNPKDARYKNLKGKTAVTPVFNIEVPIIAHPIADLKFGTGLVFMSKSAGDMDAVRFLREMNIEPKMAVGIDGRMNENAGMLKGLKTKEARERIIELIKKEGLLEKQEKIIHSVPICERSKDQIELIAMPELYLKQVDFKDRLLKLQKQINFFDESSRQILIGWINSVSIDWPISRRRYYGTEIPLWYCKKCRHAIVPPKGKYYRPWKEKPPIPSAQAEYPRVHADLAPLAQVGQYHRAGGPSCKCGSRDFEPETRVFDTWFDSSISPLYILKYGQKFFDKNYPCSLRPQGKEIVRTWLYYTLLRAYQLTEKPVFKNVWIHFHVLDDKGIKMSKSLGNVIDPHQVIEKFGAEPFRIWCALEGNISQDDIRCSFERMEGASKFLTKLWNVARFISLFDMPKDYKLPETDKWILNELNELIKYTKERYENFDFHNPAVRIKHFVWEVFASHYIEMVKTRVYNNENKFSKQEQNGAMWALYEVLNKILILLYPIACFSTAKIYRDVFDKEIENMSFPETSKYSKQKFTTEDIISLNSRIWKEKKDKGLSLKTKIRVAVIPEKFRQIEKDLIEAHNIEKIEYEKGIKINL